MKWTLQLVKEESQMSKFFKNHVENIQPRKFPTYFTAKCLIHKLATAKYLVQQIIRKKCKEESHQQSTKKENQLT